MFAYGKLMTNKRKQTFTGARSLYLNKNNDLLKKKSVIYTGFNMVLVREFICWNTVVYDFINLNCKTVVVCLFNYSFSFFRLPIIYRAISIKIGIFFITPYILTHIQCMCVCMYARCNQKISVIFKFFKKYLFIDQ